MLMPVTFRYSDAASKNLASQLADILEIKDIEAMILLILHRLGPQNAHTISRYMGFKRTSMYSILENLVKKQIVKRRPDKHSFLFSACSFYELSSLLKWQEQNVRQKSKALRYFQSTIFNLSLRRSDQEIPYITYYQGLDEVKQAWYWLLKNLPDHSEVLGYGQNANFKASEWQDFWLSYEEIRSKKQIFIKQLYPKPNINVQPWGTGPESSGNVPPAQPNFTAKKDPNHRTETRFLPASIFPFAANFEINVLPKQFINIYLDPLLPRITIYHDDNVAQAQRLIFQHYWELAKTSERVRNKGCQSLT